MRWIKSTSSLCPECLSPIPAEVYENDNVVYISKKCPTHGRFEDIYWSDYSMWKLFERRSIDTGSDTYDEGCPFRCGLCEHHLSDTVLAIIDVTSRCNLSCPTCFADSPGDKTGEPTTDEIKHMIDELSRKNPKPAALQLSGGEPTVRKDLPELISFASKRFDHVELNTNGLEMAKSEEYCREIESAGLSVVYLQFDGVGPRPYEVLRGKNIWEMKKKAIENHRRSGEKPAVVLVPTLIKGVNDDQIGEIIRFAVDNSDIVRGINFQPVSFCGRAVYDRKGRITIPDVLLMAEKQTDLLRATDFFPANAMSLLIERYWKIPVSCHFSCGAVSYVMIDEKGRPTPMTRYLDVEKLLDFYRRKGKLYNVDGEAGVENVVRQVSEIMEKFKLMRKNITYSDLSDLHFRMILIGAMHFMDAYNFDTDRVRRCVIHYAVRDGRIIPFCSYNNIWRWRNFYKEIS